MGFSSASNLRLFIPQFHRWLFLQNPSRSAPPITDIKQPDTALQSTETNFSQHAPPFWIIRWCFFLPLLQDHWSFLLNYLICYSDHWIGYSFQIVNIFLSGLCSFIYFYNEIPYFFPSLCSWFPLNPWTYLYLVLGLYMILLSVISMFVPTECFFSWLKITSSCFFMCFQFF